MSYFYLIRHAQKKNLKGDPSLSETGIKQAKTTAKYLKKFPISHIFTSPFNRTKETAEYIAQEFNLPLQIDERLTERMNWGDDQSLSFEDFLRVWERTSTERDYQPNVGDSSRAAGKRLENVVEEVSSKYPNAHSVLVSYGGVIVDFLRNIFPEAVLNSFKSDFTKEREKHVQECSITIIEKENGKYSLKELAYINHIPFPIE